MDHDDVVACSIGDHGHPYNARKRGAEDPLDAIEVQSGISNHFKKLRLNHAPVQVHTVDRPPHAPASAPNDVDLMPVDETPSKIYIHDLAAEIAQIEAEEPKDFFLADVDKKVSAIPATLLQNSHADPNMQMILYREPSSISVPVEEDAVRKAIIDARRRVRERQRAEREDEERNGRINGNRRFWLGTEDGGEDGGEEGRRKDNGGYTVHGVQPNGLADDIDEDPDAMDIG